MEAPLSATARSIFAEALAACSVERAFAAKLQPCGASGPYAFTVCGGVDEPSLRIDLAGCGRVLILAAGKGAATMLEPAGASAPPFDLLCQRCPDRTGAPSAAA